MTEWSSSSHSISYPAEPLFAPLDHNNICSCFPMLPHYLPCRVSRGAATLPHRLPLRSIPPQRFACGSSHSRGHGRPRSVRKSSRLRWKCLSMDCRCSDIANLSAHLPRLHTPPPYLRQMRLLPGRGAGVGCWIWLLIGRVRRSCKSPRARILVLGTSGAHWPARWPQFVLTERVDKS